MAKITYTEVTDNVTPAKLRTSLKNAENLLYGGKVDENNFFEDTIAGETQLSCVLLDKIIDAPENSKPFIGEIMEVYDTVYGDALNQIEWCMITNADGNSYVYYEITYINPTVYVTVKDAVNGNTLAVASGLTGAVLSFVPVGGSALTGYIIVNYTAEQDDSAATYIVPLAYSQANLIYEQYKKISKYLNTYDYTIRSYPYQITWKPSDVNGQLTDTYREASFKKDKKYRRQFLRGSFFSSFGIPMGTGLNLLAGKKYADNRDIKIQTVEEKETSFIKNAVFGRPRGFELLKVSPMGDTQVQVADKGTEGNNVDLYLAHSLSDDKIIFSFEMIFSEGRKFEEGENVSLSGVIQTFWRRKL